jgi:DNA (cytosine-5)-methyltransferase 1
MKTKSKNSHSKLAEYKTNPNGSCIADQQEKLIGAAYKTIDLFAGIGGIRLGFEKFGCETVFASEWDKSAQDMYEANFGTRPFGDINEISPHDVPDHDILLAGFPCQPFSIAGKGLGFFDTRGTLFFNIQAILEAKKPKAFLLENVKRLTTHDNGNTFRVITEILENIGYKVYTKVLNSLDFGVPQKRERIYIVGFLERIHFDFPKPLGYFKPLSEILESDKDVPESYFLSERIRDKRRECLKSSAPYPSIWHENIAGNISALPYSCALRAGGSYNYLVVNGQRRLTSREMLRLQGFPDTFKITIPYSQARKVAGNSVTVPVITAIAEKILLSLEEKKEALISESQLMLLDKKSNYHVKRTKAKKC